MKKAATLHIAGIVITLAVLLPKPLLAADLFKRLSATGASVLGAARNSSIGTFKTQVINAGGSALGAIRNSPVGSFKTQVWTAGGSMLHGVRNSSAGSMYSWARDTHTGVKLWAQDTARGVCRWGTDTAVSQAQFALTAGRMIAADPGEMKHMPSHMINAGIGWIGDTQDRVALWGGDSLMRVSEWMQDPIIGQDFVERYMVKNNIPLSEKPRAMRAMHEMGMFRLEKQFTPEIIGALLKDKLAPGGDGRKLAVVLFPTADYNGAYNDDQRIFTDLIKNGYRIDYSQVGSDIEMVSALEKASSLANNVPEKFILIGGHGAQNVIQFGGFGGTAMSNRDVLDLSDGAKIWKLQGNPLFNNARVVLSSCSTGQGKEKGNNMVNALSAVFSQARQIIGPVGDSSEPQLNFADNGVFSGVLYPNGNRNSFNRWDPKKRVPAYDGIAAASRASRISQ